MFYLTHPQECKARFEVEVSLLCLKDMYIEQALWGKCIEDKVPVIQSKAADAIFICSSLKTSARLKTGLGC